jgi:hypothetical protein
MRQFFNKKGENQINISGFDGLLLWECWRTDASSGALWRPSAMRFRARLCIALAWFPLGLRGSVALAGIVARRARGQIARGRGFARQRGVQKRSTN